MSKATKQNQTATNDTTVTNEVATMSKVENNTVAANDSTVAKEDKVMSASDNQVGKMSKVASSDKAANDSKPKGKTKFTFNKNKKPEIMPVGVEKLDYTLRLNYISEGIQAAKDRATTWYNNTIQELYEILGMCYLNHYWVECAEGRKERDASRGAVDIYYKKLDTKEVARTTETKIVAIVFNFKEIDRKTRSRYARVIKAAYASNVPPKVEKFVEWVIGKGGITGVLENKAAKDKPSVEQMREQVGNASPKTTLPFKSTGNRFVVMLANPIDNETVEILWSSESDSLANAVIEKAYADMKANGKLPPLEEHKTSKDIADEMAQAKETAEV